MSKNVPLLIEPCRILPQDLLVNLPGFDTQIHPGLKHSDIYTKSKRVGSSSPNFQGATFFEQILKPTKSGTSNLIQVSKYHLKPTLLGPFWQDSFFAGGGIFFYEISL